MRQDDIRDLEANRLRRLRDRDRDDFGQADYSDMYAYDPRTRAGYRADETPPMPPRDSRDLRARRDGPSDRVLWAVVMERLDAERRLDLRDVQVEVVDGEVILTGVVRHKADKRRIEDIADIDGVRNVQNNLKPRDRGRWTFL